MAIQILNEKTEEEIRVSPYQLSPWRCVITICFVVWTGGLLLLPLYWKENWFIAAFYAPALNYNDASIVLIKDKHGQYRYRKLQLIEIRSAWAAKQISESIVLSLNESGQTNTKTIEPILFYKLFSFHKWLYVISETGVCAHRVCSLEILNHDQLHALGKNGISEEEQIKRSEVFGENTMEINVRSIPVLIFKEALHPFYVFQVFSVIVWCIEGYYIYSITLIIISIISISWNVGMTRIAQNNLQKMAQAHNTVVDVVRDDGKVETVFQSSLVPGDVIEIPRNGCLVSCDAVILSGTCIVNESMLTGESVPVTKTALPNNSLPLSISDNKHIIFCGTNILQSRNYMNESIRAVVIRTGFLTAKGDLIRAILYPKPTSFHLHRDSIMFVGILAIFAFIGAIFTMYMMIDVFGLGISDCILYSLDIITIAIPPALPAALSIGMACAQQRLKSKKIFCISPQRINLAGALDCICFDKTGTLTEDHLQIRCVIPSVTLHKPFLQGEYTNVDQINKIFGANLFVRGLASCHMLTNVEELLAGDPIDLEIFKFTGWKFKEVGGEKLGEFESLTPIQVCPPNKNINIGIVKQFPFSSELQRMSVITRSDDEDCFTVFVKGSPEKIVSLSTPDSIPANYESVLSMFTEKGFRVIALASKVLSQNLTWHKIQKLEQTNVETNLEFMGLIVFQNFLKPETTASILDLHAADLKTIMVTGDNLNTAVSVANECGLVPPSKFVHILNDLSNYESYSTLSTACCLAMDGVTFSEFCNMKDETVKKEILKKCFIFARMKPDEKVLLVEMLQAIGYHVGMCGDGANDCGALKTAHAGISLSELEASAAAPFTSQVQDISCVITLIREGRAALANSFSAFKFIGLCSLIQFTSVLLLYSQYTALSDYQYLYIDLIDVTFLMFTLSRTAPNPKLTADKPIISLTDRLVVASLISHVVLQALAQVGAFIILLAQPSYIELDPDKDDVYENVYCQENFAVFTTSIFVYQIVALAMSHGPPFRKLLIYNKPYVLVLLILTAINLFLLFHPPGIKILEEQLELDVVDDLLFKFSLLSYLILIGAISVCLEIFIFTRYKPICDIDRALSKVSCCGDADGAGGVKIAEIPLDYCAGDEKENCILSNKTAIEKECEKKLPQFFVTSL